MLEWRAEFFFKRIDKNLSDFADWEEIDPFTKAVSYSWKDAHRFKSEFWLLSNENDKVPKTVLKRVFLNECDTNLTFRNKMLATTPALMESHRPKASENNEDSHI